MKILIVEDSKRLRESLSTAFRNEGFVVDSTADGNEGLWYGLHHPYDGVILDIMLPGMDGLSILQAWRSANIETPVLLLTAKDQLPDRVKGLRIGADDYLTKPFALEELIERVRALARRGQRSITEQIQIGPLHINSRTREASIKTTAIPLTPKEYRLLELLCKKEGHVLSRADIEEHIYDNLTEPSSNVVDTTVAALRRKLRQAHCPDILHTRRGHGYFIAFKP